ncbi:MAG: putative helicase [Paenibacillus sp.]|nr:putative helicase [Paenibacillus sp.]
MARKQERTGKAVQMELNLVPADYERLQAEVHRLRLENANLQSEVRQLKNRLQVQDGSRENVATSTLPPETLKEAEADPEQEYSDFNVTKQSDLQDKIALFRSFFRGREDVYALRGVDKTGKAGYFRAREYLGKENGRAVWGEDLPLTDAVIAQHLQREQRPVTLGLYPLLTNDTCWFLAVDFDKSGWQEDSATFLSVCRHKKVPAALERSRSGNGGHVWIFIEEPLPAKTARMLGSSLLTLALEHRHQIGLDSYDRMLPNQDTLPKDKKLGNLIALPLQRGPGKAGNSLFVDDDLEPYRDQWQFLSFLRKMKRMEAEALVDEAQRKGSVLRIARASDEEDDDAMPWHTETATADAREESFPARMKLVISAAQINALIRLAAFQNPDFYKAQKMRLSAFGKPRIINCSAEFSRHIALPRGCLGSVLERLESRGTTVELSDERVTGQPLQIDFRAELKAEQSKAAAELLRYDTGILAATTAFGKTVIGAWMIAARGVSTLVLVHRRQLLEQWKAQLALFLTVPADEIGQWGGGKNSRTGRLDVAMLQSVHGCEDLPAVLGEYGQIIVDECHHISAFSFEQVLSRARSKYVLGLTATYVCKDGHHPIVSMQCARYATAWMQRRRRKAGRSGMSCCRDLPPSALPKRKQPICRSKSFTIG